MRRRKPIWHRIIPFTIAVLTVLGLTVFFTVQLMTSDDATDAVDTPAQTSQSTAKPKATASKTATGLTKAQVAAKQQTIKKNLTAYLKQITASGHVAVSFYNLAPVAGSGAAKATDAGVYQAGALAVSANGAQRMVAASTFKLYITAWLFHEVETGARSWTSSDEDGFQRMIVNSENDYAENILYAYGAATLNQYYSQFGVQGVFKTAGAATTSSDDLLTMLKLIVNAQGPFANATYRNKLLTAMGKQIYRSGIPAAASAVAPGSTVQDKVGWLGTTDNDAAIVTTAQGQRYLLVIMTDNGSYQDFSQINTYAQQIQTIVYGKQA